MDYQDSQQNSDSMMQQPMAVVVETRSNKTHYSIVSFLYFVIMLFALYLSFLCNNGLDIGGFLMALFFPYIYIIYKLATVKDFCGLNKML